MSFDRIETLRRGIIPARSKAIEIGPLDNPILPKSHYDVIYLDYTSAQALATKYADDASRREMVDVDLLWDGGGPLANVVGERGPFDAVVASHVVEHIPDPIRWLSHLAQVVRPGGIVCLAVPDMRFTFDVNRRLSEFADLLDAHLRGDVRPSYAQLFDYHTKAIPVDANRMWDGLADYRGEVRPGELRREAFDACVALSQGGPYIDVHCHTFTPASFVDIFQSLGEFGLVDFEIADLVPTRQNGWEFFVRLDRTDPDATSEQRDTRFATGLDRARRAIADGPVPAVLPVNGNGESVAPSGRSWYLVSDRERRLLEAKKQLRMRARRQARQLLNRVDRAKRT